MMITNTALFFTLFSPDVLSFKVPDALYRRKSSCSNNVGLLYSTTKHPAVEGWPEKYNGNLLNNNEEECGPRKLHSEFTVEPGTVELLQKLDVKQWPTWKTIDNPKWVVNKQNVDKIMPYGELSYVLKGKLEIIPDDKQKYPDEKYIISEGDFVTFPEGFKSSWRVLEELTWHYYLY